MASGCGADDGESSDADGQADEQADGQDEQAESGEAGEPPPAIGDRCEDTALTLEAPTTIAATLRNAEPDPQGIAASCGLTGPTVFAEASVGSRADLTVAVRGRTYSPKFAVLLPGCTSDPDRVLACGDALPVTLADLGPDVDVLIAIGIDADDPALAAEPAALDPLDLELRLELRPVLAEHDRCGPAFGRCESGTVCLATDEGGEDRCTRPPADSCAAPGSLAVSASEASVIEIASSEAHSDAHEHSCAGWRRLERVERLELPAGLGEDATLTVTADDPRVGLALRGFDCLPEHELACAPATNSGDAIALSLTGPELASLAAGEQGPLLFIELPFEFADEAAADPPAVVHVSVEIVE